MAVQFAQPYRFSEQQLARMADAGIIPRTGTELIDGIPHRAGAPIRFSGTDYERMGETGVLHEDERVEFVDGEVIAMSPVGGPHGTCVLDVDDYLHAAVGPEVHVLMQYDLNLGERYVVPDLMLLRRAGYVRGKLPAAAACMLAVEVSDSTVMFDRYAKREMYAQAGVPEYWVLDLTTRTVVHHRHPVSGDYQSVAEHPRGASFVSPALGGREVRVDDLILS